MVQSIIPQSLWAILPKSLGRFPKDFGIPPQRLWGTKVCTTQLQGLYHTASRFIPYGFKVHALNEIKLIHAMPINYIKKKRTVYSHGTRKDAYVARIQYTGHIDEATIADDISRATTASDSEVSMYIRELEKMIGKYLIEGYVVKFDNLGTFSPAFDATTVDDPNEVTHRTVKRKKIIFTPSAGLQKMMDEASLHLADSRVAKPIDHRKKK